MDGIDLDGTTNALVAHNEVRDSSNDGIALFNNATNNRVKDNESSKNGNDGVFVEGGSATWAQQAEAQRQLRRRGPEHRPTDGTDGTGNTWDDNKCKTDNHNGRLWR